jgi:hypothetical protein
MIFSLTGGFCSLFESVKMLIAFKKKFRFLRGNISPPETRTIFIKQQLSRIAKRLLGNKDVEILQTRLNSLRRIGCKERSTL